VVLAAQDSEALRNKTFYVLDDGGYAQAGRFSADLASTRRTGSMSRQLKSYR
jgi:hypothetical protein